ncbi:MAG: winged helix-turn-helix transcriptional regulator [Bacteroidales bacterium]|nr:winged helix-turn-helix transcriptional regulator [Bacteroidales bacterium]
MDKTKLYILVTNSTALAGSSLTLEQNMRLLDEGVSSEGKTIAEQLLNLDVKAAYEFALKEAASHQMWSAYRVKLLAGKALKSYGFDCNVVRNEAALQKLCQEANEARMHARTLKDEGLYAASISIHFRVSDAELWAEGNDIVARLLMNMLQVEFGLEPLSVKNVAEYEKILGSAVREDIADIFTKHAWEVLAPVNKCARITRPTVEPKEEPLKNGARILDILTLHPRYTTADLAEALKISVKGVEKHLAKLKKSGALLRIGPDKGGHWLVKK